MSFTTPPANGISPAASCSAGSRAPTTSHYRSRAENPLSANRAGSQAHLRRSTEHRSARGREFLRAGIVHLKPHAMSAANAKEKARPEFGCAVCTKSGGPRNRRPMNFFVPFAGWREAQRLATAWFHLTGPVGNSAPGRKTLQRFSELLTKTIREPSGDQHGASSVP